MNNTTDITYEVSVAVRDMTTVHGHKDELYTRTVTVDELLLTTEDAEEYLEFGYPGNHHIQREVDNSDFGMLNTWRVLEVKPQLPLNDLTFYSKAKCKSRLKKRVQKSYEHNNGWIKPDGTFIPINTLAGHNEYAIAYLEEEAKSKGLDVFEHVYEQDGFRYPFEKLQDRGWIRVMSWGSDPFVDYYVKLNQTQINVIVDLCCQNNWDYNKLMKKDRI